MVLGLEVLGSRTILKSIVQLAANHNGQMTATVLLALYIAHLRSTFSFLSIDITKFIGKYDARHYLVSINTAYEPLLSLMNS